jgi:TRAP transporter TAXI family solute receptor
MSHVGKTLGVLIGVIAVSLSCGSVLPGSFSPFSFWTGRAHAQDMRKMAILTGPEGGTYHRFGKDIAAVVKQECGADLEVRTTKGSLANLARLHKEPFTQLAIVQQDVLDFVRLSKGNPEIEKWIDRFRYVLPLHREEVHVIARRHGRIRTVADLRGRRVAVGDGGSGTFLTATLFRLQAIDKGRDRMTAVGIGAREGLMRLLGLEGGERVDAVFYVAGQPVPLLAGLDERITERHLARLSLVAIPSTHVSERYAPARLSPEAYPWLDGAVETVSVRAVLIAYDFKGPQCDNVAMAARLIEENLDELRERLGHPKWRTVDPDAEVPGWERYACVAARQSTPIEGCRFTQEATSRPARVKPPGVSSDCSRECNVRAPDYNPLTCQLCTNILEHERKRR